MSKIIVVQDCHFKGVNSKNRIGNYFQELLIKFEEVLSIAKKEKVEFILDAGDLFDGAKPAYNVLDELADLVEKYKILIYSIYGNHSMEYAHVENSNATGLAHLHRRVSLFKLMPHFKNGNQYEIMPIELAFGIEGKIKNEGIIFEESKRWKIAVTHCLITPSKFFENASYVEYKDIQTNGDLIICSHYHSPFIKQKGNTTFLNIGCFGRDNINEAKIEPSILLLDTDKRSYEIIKLKSAKPGNEVFDLSKYEEIKENEHSIDDFIATLNSATWQASDIYQQVEMIGKEQSVEKNVIDYLQTLIKKVKEK